MTDITPQSIIERYRRAKERRAVWESHWQFSCWNKTDPNRAKIESVGRDNRNFQSCLRIARRALAGTLKDPTVGATHYHNQGRPTTLGAGQNPCRRYRQPPFLQQRRIEGAFP